MYVYIQPYPRLSFVSLSCSSFSFVISLHFQVYRSSFVSLFAFSVPLFLFLPSLYLYHFSNISEEGRPTETRLYAHVIILLASYAERALMGSFDICCFDLLEGGRFVRGRLLISRVCRKEPAAGKVRRKTLSRFLLRGGYWRQT